MYFRLSRIAFWLAAVSVGWTLVAPRERVGPGVALAGGGALMSVLLRWLAARHPEPAGVEAGAPVRTLGVADLQHARRALQAAVEGAASFEAALHAAARVLRNELGALQVKVHEVRSIGPAHAQLAELVASQPGFRGVSQRVALDALALGTALRSGLVAGAPPHVVVPVVDAGQVVALIELGSIELPIEAAALADLLTSARTLLSQKARLDRAEIGDAASPVADTAQVEPRAASGRPAGYPAAAVSGMLEDLAPLVDRTRRDELDLDDHLSVPPVPTPGPALLTQQAREITPSPSTPPHASAVPAASEPDLLDADAIARLRELDPTGRNQLVERVLKAFQTSAARLLPQARAARASGDRAALRLVVHTWKSSSASVGALQLSKLCAQIETRIRLDDTSPLDADLDALDRALENTLQAIARLLERGA